MTDLHDHHADHGQPASHDAHADHVDHAGHGDHSGHGGHGDHVGQFRRLFWIMLVLSIPVVGFNDMFADLIGYDLPQGSGRGGCRRSSGR